MKVCDLIKALRDMPQDAELMHIWDGEPRTHIDHVWIARGEGSITERCSVVVMTAGSGEVVYSDDARPEYAPTVKECAYWKTPKEGGQC